MSEYPNIIYLIPGESEGERCTVWCDDPAPTNDHDPDEAVRYVRCPVDTLKTDNTAVIERLERERDELRAHCERLRELSWRYMAAANKNPNDRITTRRRLEDALNETPQTSLREVRAEANEKSAEVAYALLEMHGTVSEYQNMPCESLRKRMFSTLQRHKSRIKLAGEIYADQIRSGEYE